MKLPEKTTEVTGTLTFARSTPMRIHEAATARLIRDAFTNIYSNQYESVLREVASNGYDAHVRAGQTEPVHIGLPDALNPNLVIEDFGVGMDAHELDMSGQYGFSDKHDTNEENGGFGLGFKSPLSICTQFTVRSVKNGLLNTVVIGFDEQGNPAVNFLNDEPIPTDLPSGTKITIPTSEVQRFQNAYHHNAFIGWPVGSVKFNGEFPEMSVHDPDLFTPVEGAWKIADGGHAQWSNSQYGWAVIGTALYSVKWSEVKGLNDKLTQGFLQNYILNIPIGAVDLISNREQLRYTPRTRRFLDEAVAKLIKTQTEEYAKAVADTTIPREAHLLVRKASEQGFDTSSFTFGSVKIGNFKALDRDAEKRVNNIHLTPRGTSYSQSKNKNVTTYKTVVDGSFTLDSEQSRVVDAALRDEVAILVTEMEQDFIKPKGYYYTITEYRGSSKLAGYIRAYADQNDKKYNEVNLYVTALSEAELGESFTGAFTSIITAADALEVAVEHRKEKAREARKNYVRGVAKKLDPVPVRQFGALRDGDSYYEDVKIEDLDATQKYILLQKNADGLSGAVERILTTQVGYRNNRNSKVLLSAAQHLKNEGYVFLHANASWKTETYKDFLPNLVEFKDALEEYVKASLKGISKMELTAIRDQPNLSYNYGYNWAQGLRAEHIKSIKRRQTREWVELMQDKTLMKRFEFVQAIIKSAEAFGLNRDKYKLSTKDLESPGKRYRLLTAVNQHTMDPLDVVEYVNWVDSK